LSKLGFIILTVFAMVSITLLADSITVVEVTSGLNADVGTEVTSGFGGVLSFIQTFFDIMTFNLDGIPPVVNLLFFLPITIGMVYVIAGIVKDIIPFT